MPTNIVVPELGESVVEARVAKWLKSEGDQVAIGEALVELETEKIDLEVSADRAGVLGSITHAAGADVKVGETLAVLDDLPAAGPSARNGRSGEAPPPAVRSEADRAKTGPEPAKSGAAQPAGAAKPEADAGGKTAADVKATPTARNVARDAGVKLEAIAASGAGGRVMKDDVLRAKPSAPASITATHEPAHTAAPSAPSSAAQAPAGGASALSTSPSSTRTEERTRMSKRRATIARRLVEAQHNAAMLTTFNEVDMSGVMTLRERRKEAFQKQYGVGLGIASFFVKAAVGALKAFPQLNGEIQGDEIVLKHYYDIGMAVGAEGGLVVPVIRDADRQSFAGVEHAIRDFAKRAQDGTLTLEDLKGGTFTITNGGVFGSLMSTPILNPPQVGILGLHKIADRAIVVGGQVVVRPMMYLALSYDHRIVDGREAVQFLVKVKDYIEDPAMMAIAG